jgi:hypothetical protein
MAESSANRVRFTLANNPGASGDLIVDNAAAKYKRLGAAHDGATDTYLIEQGSAWEIRSGCTYTHGTSTLSRGTLEESSTGAAVAFTSAAIVSLVTSGTMLKRLAVAPIVAYVDASWTRTRNNANLAAQIADMDAGMTLALPRGDFTLDLLPAKTLRIFGAGKPRYSSGTLAGGTIIRGEINVQNLVGVEVGFLGVQQVGLTPASYPNAITGGSTTAGDSSTLLDQSVHDIVIVGQGYASGGNAQHGVLFQNGRGFDCHRVDAYAYLNAFISRASGARFERCLSVNAEANAVYFKSASAGGANNCYDNTAVNCRGVATANGYLANFSAYAEASSANFTRNNRFIDCIADATGTTTAGATFYAQGTGNPGSIRGTTFIGCTSKGDRSGAAFLSYDDFNEGTVFIGCNAEDFGGFSFSSNATSSTNLPTCIGGTCWRSGFANIVNVNGQWAEISVNGQPWDTGQARPVSALPAAGYLGRIRVVSDASSPSYLATVTGGGSTVCRVLDNGSAWVCC